MPRNLYNPQAFEAYETSPTEIASKKHQSKTVKHLLADFDRGGTVVPK